MTMKRSSGEQQGPDPKRSRPRFFIDSLLGHHSTATNGLGRQQQEGEPNSNSRRPGAATASTTMASRKLRKSRVEPERRLAVESPPLDEANWLPARPDPKSLRDLNCQLDNLETWQQFDQLGTEMIITKSGRRMFPVLKLRFSGIRPSALYLIYMDLSPVQREHRFRYAYNKSQWQSGGKADKPKFGRLFLHTDSPFTGEQLAQSGHIVGFEKVKLTNNTDPNPKEGEQAAGIEPDQLLLNSMHKYRPRVHIFCLPKGHPMLADPPKQFRSKADLDGLSTLDYKTFSFPATQFVAVTAYQNQLVTQKKIELNPFAKGFRDQPKQENDGIPPLDVKYNGNMPRPTDSSAPHAFPIPPPPAPPIPLHRNQHQQKQNQPMWLANNLPPWALHMMLFWANPAQRRSCATPIEESREEERTPVDDGHQNEDKATELLAENGNGRKKLLAEEDLIAITNNGSGTETGEGSPKEADGGQQIPVELTAGIQ